MGIAPGLRRRGEARDLIERGEAEMIVWILVMMLGIDPCFSPNCNRVVKIVDSPQHAAIEVWVAEKEFRAAHASLYRIDTATGKAERVDIPKMQFEPVRER